MYPKPVSMHKWYHPAEKLKDKVVLVTGGDSGIGRAIVYHCAAEGAQVAFTYLNEKEDAKETQGDCDKKWNHTLALSADLSKQEACKAIVEKCHEEFQRIDILINNIAVAISVKIF